MNKENDQFERLLKSQPLRQIPAEWRNEILTATTRMPSTRSVKPAAEHSFLSALNHRLRSLLWPHPAAWGGLAAIWVFIFVLNFSSRDHVSALAGKASSPTPTVIAELRQQQRLYVELMDLKDPGEADRQKTFRPGPHSERIKILAV